MRFFVAELVYIAVLTSYSYFYTSENYVRRISYAHSE